ncbi:hypothetical protein H8959_000968 [Pygathrix nigripes]
MIYLVRGQHLDPHLPPSAPLSTRSQVLRSSSSGGTRGSLIGPVKSRSQSCPGTSESDLPRSARKSAPVASSLVCCCRGEALHPQGTRLVVRGRVEVSVSALEPRLSPGSDSAGWPWASSSPEALDLFDWD